VAVLKGAGTLIARQGAPVCVSMPATGMASGGMGDVLAGVIAGLLAQGLPLFEAAQAGVLAHALAAMRRRATASVPVGADLLRVCGASSPCYTRSMTMLLTIASAEDMEALGARLAHVCTDGALITLQGELVPARRRWCAVCCAGWLSGKVKSPTYTLVEPYALGDRRVYHFDLYRLVRPKSWTTSACAIISMPRLVSRGMAGARATRLPRPTCISSSITPARAHRLAYCSQ